MKPDADTTCPYTGHKDKCRAYYDCCPKWINVIGTDPQTGESVNQWNCADYWIPKLMVENSQMQRQTSASVDSFRNEMSAQNTELNRQLTGGLNGDLRLKHHS